MQMKRTVRNLLTSATLAGAALLLTPAPQANAQVYSPGYAPAAPQDTPQAYPPADYAPPAPQAYGQNYPSPDYGPSADGQAYPSASYAPPAIPVYDQPPMPGDGYIWTPGYWAWGPGGFYWVDGAWVLPPYAEALWTPGWWGFDDSAYFWHPGYWGRSVGYYGGINYGFGYFGVGFYGGY